VVGGWNNMICSSPLTSCLLAQRFCKLVCCHTHPRSVQKKQKLLLCKFWPKVYKRNKGVCHIVTLPFTLKSILRQKKNYRNSNIISPSRNIIFQKSSKRNQIPSRYYNSIITNLKFQHKPKSIMFQKSSYKNRSITYIGAKNPLSYSTL